jgi:pre-mRNA-splicing helicase BRR2
MTCFCCGMKVVVVSKGLCWALGMSSHLVVVMDTQDYDGRGHRLDQ